ncbi:MAG: hypothetical protein AABX11_02325 [Nanoarchaeota archaeon]
MSLQFKLGGQEDIPQVKELLGRNLYLGIPMGQRANNGFLRYDIEPEVFDRCAREGNLVVARNERELAGYMVCFTKEQSMNNPFFSEFLRNAQEMEFEGKKISNLNFVIYAQVCIDKRFRHQGTLAGLHRTMRDIQREKYDIGISEIDQENAVSWNANIKRAGVIHVGNYAASSGANWRVVVLNLHKKLPFDEGRQ